MSTMSIADGDVDVDAEWQQQPAHSTSSTGQRALLRGPSKAQWVECELNCSEYVQ